MTCVHVKTQTQLDEALAGDATCVHIESDAGVWLRVGASGSATVRAYGSATVRAYGSATVEASGSATVEASGSATVEASGSATVEASGSATVRAYGSATVRAYGSATVEAYGSATVEAYGSATVEAYGSATVRASGNTSVHANQRAKITAGPHVAVHLHSAQATVTGGVVIDLTQLDLTDPATWCAHHGVDVVDGQARLYKAVDTSLTAGHDYILTAYPIGQTVTCGDWRDDNDCGGGLHASPRPWQAKRFAHHPGVRYLIVAAPVESIWPIEDDKCKAPAWAVLSEVDAYGRELATAQGGELS